MTAILQDLRYCLRLLVKNPSFSIIAILTFAFGISINIATFSLVYGVLIKPLPYPQPQQLVDIYSEFPGTIRGERVWLSPPELFDLKRNTHSWQALEGWANKGANLSGTTQPVRVKASFVTGGLLQSIGVSPAIGRTITQQDIEYGAPQVAVISHKLWTRAFGNESDIVGRDVLLDDVKVTIIGIMPKGFDFPPNERNPPEIWLPFQLNPANSGKRDWRILFVLGRLKSGVTFAQAKVEMNRFVEQQGKMKGSDMQAFSPDRHPIVMYPLGSQVADMFQKTLLMYLMSASISLLITWVNVTNLLLARIEARQHEITIRIALGASMGRLVRQFITEGVVLAVSGAAVGLLIAHGVKRLIIATSEGALPRAEEISINSQVLLFTLGICFCSGIIFGITPLAYVKSQNFQSSFKSFVGRITISGASRATRQVFISIEIAIAMVLLIGSGLMIRSYWNLRQVNPGFNTKGSLTMQVTLPQRVYIDKQSVLRFWTQLQNQAIYIPSVESVSLVSDLPPDNVPDYLDTYIKEKDPDSNTVLQSVNYYNIVSPNYFDTMRIQLLEGRFLADSDSGEANLVAVINRSLAYRFYGNESPLGRRIRHVDDPNNSWRTIVGVVADIKNSGLDEPVKPEMFIPLGQMDTGDFRARNLFVVLRFSGNIPSLVHSVTEIIQGIDPSLPISKIRTMEDIIASNLSLQRFLTLLLGLFSGIHLVLTSSGIFAIMEYSVAQRRHEIGIQMALGAPQVQVLKMILKDGAILTLIGVVIGLLGSIFIAKLLQNLLVDVTALDPLTFLVAPLVLIIVALVTCYIPVRRVTRINPIVVLRDE